MHGTFSGHDYFFRNCFWGIKKAQNVCFRLGGGAYRGSVLIFCSQVFCIYFGSQNIFGQPLKKTHCVFFFTLSFDSDIMILGNKKSPKRMF